MDSDMSYNRMDTVIYHETQCAIPCAMYMILHNTKYQASSYMEYKVRYSIQPKV